MKNWTLTMILGLGVISYAQAQSDSEAVAAPADTTSVAVESMDATPETPEATATPELPETVEYEVPEGDVFVDFEEGEGGAAAPTVSREAETISVDFPDEDVRTIIRSVADMYELNVVIPETLTGTVSIKLRNVTWRQVFAVVLEPLNFTYVEDRNIIKIKSREELMAEPVDTRVFVINFATAGDLKNSIQPLVDPAAGGKIQVDTRSNALVITERPSRMNGIQEIIERLDRPTEQVMIESKFIEITDTDDRNIGVDWGALRGYSVGVNPSFNNAGAFGSFQKNRVTENGVVTTDAQTENFSAVFTADQFSLVLSALNEKSDVELISNPTVVTMNNTPARINIGEEYPIPSYTYNDERGRFEVSGFEYKPIGVLLRVTPQINSAGFINMKINPEISSSDESVNFGAEGGSAQIPIITTRNTESTVTIKSGYTLAIGGLVQTTTSNADNSVPVLGKIPGIGRLFSSKSDSVSKRNLVIFITAKILSASGATYEDIYTPERLFEMGIDPTEIPEYKWSESEKAMLEQQNKQEEDNRRLQNQDTLDSNINALEAERREILKQRLDENEKREVRRNYQ